MALDYKWFGNFIPKCHFIFFYKNSGARCNFPDQEAKFPQPHSVSGKPTPPPPTPSVVCHSNYHEKAATQSEMWIFLWFWYNGEQPTTRSVRIDWMEGWIRGKERESRRKASCIIYVLSYIFREGDVSLAKRKSLCVYVHVCVYIYIKSHWWIVHLRVANNEMHCRQKSISVRI